MSLIKRLFVLICLLGFLPSVFAIDVIEEVSNGDLIEVEVQEEVEIVEIVTIDENLGLLDNFFNFVDNFFSYEEVNEIENIVGGSIDSSLDIVSEGTYDVEDEISDTIRDVDFVIEEGIYDLEDTLDDMIYDIEDELTEEDRMNIEAYAENLEKAELLDDSLIGSFISLVENIFITNQDVEYVIEGGLDEAYEIVDYSTFDIYDEVYYRSESIERTVQNTVNDVDVIVDNGINDVEVIINDNMDDLGEFIENNVEQEVLEDFENFIEENVDENDVNSIDSIYYETIISVDNFLEVDLMNELEDDMEVISSISNVVDEVISDIEQPTINILERLEINSEEFIESLPTEFDMSNNGSGLLENVDNFNYNFFSYEDINNLEGIFDSTIEDSLELISDKTLKIENNLEDSLIKVDSSVDSGMNNLEDITEKSLNNLDSLLTEEDYDSIDEFINEAEESEKLDRDLVDNFFSLVNDILTDDKIDDAEIIINDGFAEASIVVDDTYLVVENEVIENVDYAQNTLEETSNELEVIADDGLKHFEDIVSGEFEEFEGFVDENVDEDLIDSFTSIFDDAMIQKEAQEIELILEDSLYEVDEIVNTDLALEIEQDIELAVKVTDILESGLNDVEEPSVNIIEGLINGFLSLFDEEIVEEEEIIIEEEVEKEDLIEVEKEIETEVQSINGRSIDVMDFMSTSLSRSVNRGYNSIEFDIVNRESVPMDLSITVMSRDLSFDFSIEKKIGIGGSKSVEVPLFIGSNVKPGKYPVRFSVNSGNDKQTRYSYIIVK